MAEPEWLSYIGAACGVIGAVTGIAGAVMGYIGYRRTEDLQTLDLRLELKRTENDLRREVEALPAHLEYAKKSRTAAASATGRHGSGAMKKWLEEWGADLALAQSMVSAAPSASANYEALDHATLEARLVAGHAVIGSARQLREKYDAMLADDDKQRDHIREDVRVRMQGRTEG